MRVTFLNRARHIPVPNNFYYFFYYFMNKISEISSFIDLTIDH